MKGLRILAVLAIAALVLAPVATYAGTDKDKPATAQSGKSTEKQVTVVSVDQDAKTITIREAGTPSATPGAPGGSATTSNEKTVPVTGQAINKLKSLRPGQQVTVTATLNDAGEISAISDLNLEPASGSTRQP